MQMSIQFIDWITNPNWYFLIRKQEYIILLILNINIHIKTYIPIEKYSHFTFICTYIALDIKYLIAMYAIVYSVHRTLL